jgi:cell division protein FtsL
VSARHRHHNDLTADVLDAIAGGDAADVRASAAPPGRGRPRRARTRRGGGSRTPWPLLPLIAIAAVVAISYVAETAHATQAGYVASALDADQARLKAENQRLSDELARLKSAERIDTAAQQLGMRPSSRWAYVAEQPPPVAAPPGPNLAATQPEGDPFQRLVAVLSGSFGTRNAEASGR